MAWSVVTQVVLTTALLTCLRMLYHFLRFWIGNIRLIRAFPYRANWSFIYGTFNRRPGEQANDSVIRGFMEYAEMFNDNYVVFLGPGLIAVLEVANPVSVQAVMQRAEGKASSYEFFRPWLGDGLLLAKGAKWHRNRKLLTPAFHFSILKAYVNVYNEATNVLLDKLDDHCRSGTEYWNVTEDLSLASLDIILQCAFSSTINCQVNANDEYVEAVKEFTDLTTKRTLNIWVRSDFVYGLTNDGRRMKRALNIMHSRARAIIAERKAALAAAQPQQSADDVKVHRDDFLNLLLTVRDSDGNPMPDEDVQAEVDTFLFEGHDTTASAMSWTLHLLAKHQDHQVQIQHEIDALLDKSGTEHVSWNDLSELKHMTLFIKEACRLYPPVPFIGRTLESDLELDGKHVPKGTIIGISLYALHHSRHIWGADVEEFRPERFSLENAGKMHPYAYVPFSAGPRNCIGQNFAMNELKVVLARFLRRFSVKPHPSVEPRPTVGAVLRPAEGHPILLKLEPRGGL